MLKLKSFKSISLSFGQDNWNGNWASNYLFIKIEHIFYPLKVADHSSEKELQGGKHVHVILLFGPLSIST